MYDRIVRDFPTVDCIAICDDLTLVGPSDQVFKAYEWVRSNCYAMCGLTVNIPKTKVLYPRLSPIPDSIRILSNSANLVLKHGSTKLLGSIVGMDECAKKLFVSEKMAVLEIPMRRVLHPNVTCQEALLLLRSCVNSKPLFLFRTLPPTVTRDSAAEFFDALCSTVCQKLELPRPTDLPLRSALSFSLSTSMGGLGLLNPCEYLEAAYQSSLALSVQYNFKSVNSHLFLSSPDGISLPIANHIRSCLAFLNAKNVDSSHKVIAVSLNDFVERYCNGAPLKLQHLAMRCVNQQFYGGIRNQSSADPAWAACLRSASAPGACHWLTTLPSSDDLIMDDPHFKIAVRYLIGLPPSSTPPQFCPRCHADISNDPCHPLHCMLEACGGKTVQHNQIRDKLFQFSFSANMSPQKEPTQYTEAAHVKPDLMIPFADSVHCVDVSGTDPCAPSYLEAASRRTLSAAASRRQSKISQYRNLPQLFHVVFTPFVFETHGGLDSIAIDFVDKLAAESRHRLGGRSISGDFKYHLLSAISVIIQKSNAQVLIEAFANSHGRAALAAA